MEQRKKKRPGSCPPPLRFEWTKAHPTRPKDNLTIPGESLPKQPFRPSYETDGDPTMDCLLDWSYGRQWLAEVSAFRDDRKSAAAAKRPTKKIPVYPSAHFTMKQLQKVPAKVQTRFAMLRPTQSCRM